MAVVTPTDRPKSVRNRCVIEVFGGVFVLSIGFRIFCWTHVLTTISENCYYIINLHFHAHFQCLEAGCPILPSVFLSYLE